MKKVLILLLANICLNSCLQASKADDTQIKQIMIGRKDLIRNDLVKTIVTSHQAELSAMNLQINSLNKAVFIWQDEYKACQARIERCKCK